MLREKRCIFVGVQLIDGDKKFEQEGGFSKNKCIFPDTSFGSSGSAVQYSDSPELFQRTEVVSPEDRD